MKYLAGYRRNPSRRGLRIARSVAVPYESVDLAGYAPAIFDQGPTGSCVGHTRARGIYIAAAAKGAPMSFIPSPADLYRLARCYERADWDAPLKDTGCDPVDTLDGARIWGVRPMKPLAFGRFSDADPATINDTPTLGDLHADRFTRMADDFRILGFGSYAVLETAKALASGYPVGIDVPGGSDEWQTYASGTLQEVPGAMTDHYVLLTGYRRSSDGAFTFLGHNSWGASWGMRGTFQISEGVVANATDLIVHRGVLL